MHREIIHRGIKEGGRKWIIGKLSTHQGRFFIHDRNNSNLSGRFEVKYDTICEMSGLRDTKSHNEIFEGDVVYTSHFPMWDDPENIFIFRYSERDGRLRFLDVDSELYYDYDDPLHKLCNFQVIGDIYHNPEWLDVNFQTAILNDKIILQALVIKAALSPDDISIYKKLIKEAKRQTRIAQNNRIREMRIAERREAEKKELVSNDPNDLPF